MNIEKIEALEKQWRAKNGEVKRAISAHDLKWALRATREKREIDEQIFSERKKGRRFMYFPLTLRTREKGQTISDLSTEPLASLNTQGRTKK